MMQREAIRILIRVLEDKQLLSYKKEFSFLDKSSSGMISAENLLSAFVSEGFEISHY